MSFKGVSAGSGAQPRVAVNKADSSERLSDLFSKNVEMGKSKKPRWNLLKGIGGLMKRVSLFLRYAQFGKKKPISKDELNLLVLSDQKKDVEYLLKRGKVSSGVLASLIKENYLSYVDENNSVETLADKLPYDDESREVIDFMLMCLNADDLSDLCKTMVDGSKVGGKAFRGCFQNNSGLLASVVFEIKQRMDPNAFKVFTESLATLVMEDTGYEQELQNYEILEVIDKAAKAETKEDLALSQEKDS